MRSLIRNARPGRVRDRGSWTPTLGQPPAPPVVSQAAGHLQPNATTMPRQHHSVFRGWLRQSPLFERQLTGRRNLLTADQIRCLLRAGWYLDRDGIWRDHLGGTYTEEQALAWLNSPTQS